MHNQVKKVSHSWKEIKKKPHPQTNGCTNWERMRTVCYRMAATVCHYTGLWNGQNFQLLATETNQKLTFSDPKTTVFNWTFSIQSFCNKSMRSLLSCHFLSIDESGWSRCSLDCSTTWSTHIAKRWERRESIRLAHTEQAINTRHAKSYRVEWTGKCRTERGLWVWVAVATTLSSSVETCNQRSKKNAVTIIRER